jgi:hypothetical protein
MRSTLKRNLSQLLKRTIFPALFCMTLGVPPVGLAIDHPDGPPALVKETLFVRANRLLHYMKSPNSEPLQDTWSWLPYLEFGVAGPVPSGGVYTADFTLQDGRPWTSIELVATGSGNGYPLIATPAVPRHEDPKATLATGTFGFRIRYKNEFEGANKEIYAGKFTVRKFHVGNDLPQFRNQFEYYVDQDWTLPIGYLWTQPTTENGPPELRAAMWFRGESDDTRLAGYVFYNGKQIGSTKVDGGTSSDKKLLTSGNDADPRWERWTFHWAKVRRSGEENNSNDFFLMDKNPGEYEIKILRNGALARSAKFTVGPDGRIVDSGAAKQNGLVSPVILLPVKVLGDTEGKWNTLGWKTDAYYGNPLSGFTAP